MNSTGERKSLTFIDFFAGTGGIRRGFELAGHKCVGFCEWDKYATMSYVSMHLLTDEQREYLAKLPKRERQKEILKSEYRNGEWYADDIRTVHAADLPRADVWCFGAPCQDFSIAGKRKGLDGDRSSLVREIFRILGEARREDRPEWLFYENVVGMLTSNRGFDFLYILDEFYRGGMTSSGRYWTHSILECRNTGKECSLLDILEKNVPQKYFLSETTKAQLMKYNDSQFVTL